MSKPTHEDLALRLREAYSLGAVPPMRDGLDPIDADTIVVTDATPANLVLFVNSLLSGSAPVLFQDGTTSSALTVTYTDLASSADDIDFSNDGGTTWTYTPLPDGSGFDSSVTSIRIRPKGTMAANSSFSLTVRYKVS